MKDFLETLQALKDTPVPNLLIIGGVVLLILAIVGKIGVIIDLPTKRQKYAGIFGALLLVLGIGLFVVPKPLSPPTETPDIPISPTPIPTTSMPPTTTMTPADTPTLTLAPTTIPTGTPLPSLVVDDFGVQMALVPAGSFEMGGDAGDALAECQMLYEPFSDNDCQSGWFEDQEPAHTVYLDDYYIDLYEVTNALYAACVEAGVCDPPSDTGSYTRSNYYGDSRYEGFPVIYVSWYNAKAYCEWHGGRLPSEAEWEKAARGGLEGAQYPWGDTFDASRANFCDNNCTLDWANTDFDDGYADTAPVGSYSPSGYGLYDVAGNVWEWVADWYDADYYSSSPSENPTGPVSGEYRVVRGGSWYVDGGRLRAAFRYGHGPEYRDLSFGFRCARSP